MAEKIGIKIKMFPGGPDMEGVPATTKVFIRPGSEQRKGCRPLEPGEIVHLDKKEAQSLLEALPNHVEMTFEPPTRPLYYNSQYEAEITSMNFNAVTAGRADEAKAAMNKMREDMASGAYDDNSPSRTMTPEERIAELEAELAAVRNAQNSELEERLDADLEDYTPNPDNIHNRESIHGEIAQAQRDAEEKQAVADNAKPTSTRTRRRAKKA